MRRNLQYKTCGTTRLQSHTSLTWTADDRRRAAAGLSQQNNLLFTNGSLFAGVEPDGS